MDIAALRIIHALHQHQTLGAAAEALCLTQSALSHRMKALEHEIGIAFWNKQGNASASRQRGRSCYGWHSGYCLKSKSPVAASN
ncbi:LysR family transcriptional regulator [Candidatus Thiothrix anitrata]|uniref:LysR family transcriptional regulator n=1 Tax=Candidatus Thiothrix anitrata TaxID=2823902 RepID=A0ABX7X054_9GAMM|nr:LysR family transcriptional regulator [Candidatus Thiothrix anitrata]